MRISRWWYVFATAIGLGIIALQIIWFVQGPDLHSADSLPHLNAYLDFRDSIVWFLDDPGWQRISALFATNLHHFNLPYLLTIPFDYLTDLGIFSPLYLNAFLAILLLFFLYQLSQRFLDRSKGIFVLLIYLTFPAFLGLTRYYNVDLLLAVWLIGTLALAFPDGRQRYTLVVLLCCGIIGVGVKSSTVPITLLLIYFELRNRKPKFAMIGAIAVILTVLLIHLGLSYLWIFHDSIFPPSLSPFYKAFMLEVVSAWGFDFNQSTVRYDDIPEWYRLFFYPLFLVKGLLLPSFLVLLIALIRRERSKNIDVLRMTLLAAIFGLTVIGRKKADLLHPYYPICAIIIVEWLSLTKPTTWPRFVSVLALFNFAIGIGLSFGWSKADYLVPRDRFDKAFLGYYPQPSLERNVKYIAELTGQKSIGLVNCLAQASELPLLYSYHYRRSEPGLDFIEYKHPFATTTNPHDYLLLFLPGSSHSYLTDRQIEACLSWYDVREKYRIALVLPRNGRDDAALAMIELYGGAGNLELEGWKTPLPSASGFSERPLMIPIELLSYFESGDDPEILSCSSDKDLVRSIIAMTPLKGRPIFTPTDWPKLAKKSGQILLIGDSSDSHPDDRLASCLDFEETGVPAYFQLDILQADQLGIDFFQLIPDRKRQAEIPEKSIFESIIRYLEFSKAPHYLKFDQIIRSLVHLEPLELKRSIDRIETLYRKDSTIAPRVVHLSHLLIGKLIEMEYITRSGSYEIQTKLGDIYRMNQSTSVTIDPLYLYLERWLMKGRTILSKPNLERELSMVLQSSILYEPFMVEMYLWILLKNEKDGFNRLMAYLSRSSNNDDPLFNANKDRLFYSAANIVIHNGKSSDYSFGEYHIGEMTDWLSIAETWKSIPTAQKSSAYPLLKRIVSWRQKDQTDEDLGSLLDDTLGQLQEGDPYYHGIVNYYFDFLFSSHQLDLKRLIVWLKAIGSKKIVGSRVAELLTGISKSFFVEGKPSVEEKLKGEFVAILEEISEGLSDPGLRNTCREEMKRIRRLGYPQVKGASIEALIEAILKTITVRKGLFDDHLLDRYLVAIAGRAPESLPLLVDWLLRKDNELQKLPHYKKLLKKLVVLFLNAEGRSAWKNENPAQFRSFYRMIERNLEKLPFASAMGKSDVYLLRAIVALKKGDDIDFTLQLRDIVGYIENNDEGSTILARYVMNETIRQVPLSQLGNWARAFTTFPAETTTKPDYWDIVTVTTKRLIELYIRKVPLEDEWRYWKFLKYAETILNDRLIPGGSADAFGYYLDLILHRTESVHDRQLASLPFQVISSELLFSLVIINDLLERIIASGASAIKDFNRKALSQIETRHNTAQIWRMFQQFAGLLDRKIDDETQDKDLRSAAGEFLDWYRGALPDLLRNRENDR